MLAHKAIARQIELNCIFCQPILLRNMKNNYSDLTINEVLKGANGGNGAKKSSVVIRQPSFQPHCQPSL